MPGKYEAPRGARRRRRRRRNPLLPLILCLILVVGVVGGVLLLCSDSGPQTTDPTGGNSIFDWMDPTTVPTTTAVPTETKPQPVHQVSTATLAATGDLLMHLPVINACSTGSGYDFTQVFQYLRDYSDAADYAVANLETTLCGTDNGYSYSGYPHFNCPDSIVTGAQDAGFDMLLTANNHSYDTTLVGYKRTLNVIRDTGMETLGTYASPEETKWTIKDINDISIGMLCYTYATHDVDGSPRLNGNAPISEKGLCNYFIYENLEPFYSEVETYLEEMEQAGAETTVMYIHWGVEYQTYANDQQKAIAQRLCDLGIDVIIGGHAHVVQPMDLLTSTTDPDHKTVCIYSLGNAVSNQRRELMNLSTGHTEDGMLFSVTFSKYSDGTVYVHDANVLPTWVNMHGGYRILPLDDETRADWKTLYAINDNAYALAEQSYGRTMKIVGEGLEECRTYLADAKEARDAAYIAAVEG